MPVTTNNDDPADGGLTLIVVSRLAVVVCDLLLQCLSYHCRTNDNRRLTGRFFVLLRITHGYCTLYWQGIEPVIQKLSAV